MDWLFEWLSQYGYVGLFAGLLFGILGLPIPDETLLVFCGYLISQGKLEITGTYLTALAGTCCGITVSYIIGRTAGLAAVHRFGRYLRIDQRHLDRVHRWFDHSGHWALFGGYYIAGVRHFTAIIAGASKLEFHIFVLYAWGGAATWVAAFLTLGYVIGEQWRAVAELVHRYLTYASALGIALVVLFFAGRRWMQRRTSGGASNIP